WWRRNSIYCDAYRGATSLRDCRMAPDLEQHEPTVLIIEDDESVATAMTCLLTREGYLVMTAATGHDALGMLRRPLSPIDVVILDVHLPDVSGISLCTRLREFYPKLPVIVCSGEAVRAAAPGRCASVRTAAS